MNSIKKYLNMFLNFTDKNSPAILSGCGVVGLWKTAQMMYKAGPKGKEIMDNKRKDLKSVDSDDKISKRAIMKETIKEMTPVLAPPIIMGVASSACIIGSNQISTRRIATLSAAYTLTENALNDYKEKTLKVVGEKKAQNIREAISKDKMIKNPPTEENKKEITIIGDGTCLCYDSYSGRYFNSNAQRIDSAINKLNYEIQTCMYMSLNEFWDELGLKRLPMGDDFGWNIDDCINGKVPITRTAILTPDDRPCICVDYDIHLRSDFRNLY